MGKKLERWLEQYRCMDWAVLYMRLFAGAMMFFHNIGKIQRYDEIIAAYPSVLYLRPGAVFVLVSVAEVLLAAAIVVGLRVRLAALAMSLGILAAWAWNGFADAGTSLVWAGIYFFLVLSGGGLYGFDGAFFASRIKK